MILLAATILLAALPAASAQDDSAVVVTSTNDSTFGTTDPAPGTYTYANNTIIKLTAKPNSGYTFKYWIISGGYTPGHNAPPLIVPVIIDNETFIPPSRPPATSTYDSLVVDQNPLNVICGYGYTFSYEAVFIPTTPTGTSYATVVLKSGAGGTVNPTPGTYTFAEGTNFTITATSASGNEFLYWVATGTGVVGHDQLIILENPLNILCGVGYTYEYQPIFAPTGTTTTTTGIPTEYFYAVVVILVILAVIGFGVALMYRGKTTKATT
jgi:hypothetical protein